MLARTYMHMGLLRTTVLDQTGLTKNELYYTSTGNKPGKRATRRTLWKDIKTSEQLWRDNQEVVIEIGRIRKDPDLPNYYKLICASLQIGGWYINHKKVYRLEKEHGLLAKAKKKKGRNFVKFRTAIPPGPLQIIEMDIKYIWITGRNQYGFILTIIDTFTRYVLHWTVGYSMKQSQVKRAWDYVINKYLQAADMLNQEIRIEVRNDNGKQFASDMIQRYFKENHLDQVFTHPYTPEENGHIESFHKTLSQAIEKDIFKDIESAEIRLERFYKTYNNDRPHGSITSISPMMFWLLWEEELIEMIKISKRQVRFKLLLQRQEIMTTQDITKYKYPIK